MSRQQVVKVQCSRCDRSELRDDLSLDGNDLVSTPVCSGRMTTSSGVLQFSWEDLCGPCQKAVKNHFEAIAKKVEGCSPDRKEQPKKKEAKKKDAAPSGPSSPPTQAPKGLSTRSP